MEGLLVLVVLLWLAIFVGAVLGVVAYFKTRAGDREGARLEDSLRYLSDRLARLEQLFRKAGLSPPTPAGEEGPPPAAAEEITRRPAPVARREPEAPAEVVPELPEVPSLLREPEAPAPPPLPEAAPTALPEALFPGIDREWWAKFEKRVGERWLTWVGVLALFFGVGFFVKYAIDNQWLTPKARVVIGLGVGLVLLVLGDRFVRRRMRALGQGLMGGGLAILYVSLFAACSF